MIKEKKERKVIVNTAAVQDQATPRKDQPPSNDKSPGRNPNYDTTMTD